MDVGLHGWHSTPRYIGHCTKCTLSSQRALYFKSILFCCITAPKPNHTTTQNKPPFTHFFTPPFSLYFHFMGTPELKTPQPFCLSDLTPFSLFFIRVAYSPTHTCKTPPFFSSFQ